MHKEREPGDEPRTQRVRDSVSDADRSLDAVLTEIAASLRGLRFGSVNVIVQDGVVVQIDRMEKRRLKPRAGTE